jgi:hypothetical protein
MSLSRAQISVLVIGLLVVGAVLCWWLWPQQAPGMLGEPGPVTGVRTAPVPVDHEGNPLPIPPVFSDLKLPAPPAGLNLPTTLPGPPKIEGDRAYLDLRNLPPPPPLPDNFPGVPPLPPLPRKPQANPEPVKQQ